jgi:hypothetical protein
MGWVKPRLAPDRKSAAPRNFWSVGGDHPEQKKTLT